MNLTLVAANGTQLVLNSTRIGSLPSYTAFGGFKNVLGNIKDLGNYTGVPLTTLCSLVGGVNTSQCLLVKASDNYTVLFSYAQVNGDFVAYNSTTGNVVQNPPPLTPILAYYKNDANLSYDDGGPLKIAIVGPEGLVTNSTLWVKWVVRVDILRYDDIAVTAITPSKTVLAGLVKTRTCYFNVTVENLGGYPETFNVTLYANATVISTIINVVLAKNTSRILSFSWNTTSFAYGKYTITAKATIVPYEINTANNTLEGGTVIATIIGDVDGDFHVGILDVVKITSIYGTKRCQSGFNPNCDLDDNGVINILDVVICTSHYGSKYP
jgi:hypothetical protein